MRRNLSSLFALWLCALAVWPLYANAQSGRVQPEKAEASPSTSTDTRTSSALYEEAEKYVREKFERFNKERVPYSKERADTVYTEQREMAARHARILAARKELSPDDLFYLGMLYRMADSNEEARGALKRYLETKPSGEHAQTARVEIVAAASKTAMLEEAEQARADYLKNQPQQAEARLLMATLMASAYRQAKKLDEALERGREAFDILKSLPTPKLEERPSRVEALRTMAGMLVQLYQLKKKPDEARAVVEELRAMSFDLPSPALFRQSERLMTALGIEASELKADRSTSAASRPMPPEIVVTEWIDQKPVKLAELRGQVVLLDFWAHWCGPCISTFPTLRAWHEKYKEKGLVILGVTNYTGEAEGEELTPKEELEYLRRFKKRFKLPYGFAISDNDENDINYGIASIPTTFLLDRRGHVRFISLGAGKEEEQEIEAMIKRLLEEK